MDEQIAWDIYFSSICSLRFHPRNDDRAPVRANVEFAAQVADMMIEERRKRCPGESSVALSLVE
jgi:hypothetical protein